MAGLTAIKRKGFKGGGSDASTTSFSKSFDSQHWTNTASRANKTVDARQAAGQRDADKTNQAIANRAAIREQIKKQQLEKSKYDVGPKKNIFEKLGAYRTNYNRNYKKKQLAFNSSILDFWYLANCFFL